MPIPAREDGLDTYGLRLEQRNISLVRVEKSAGGGQCVTSGRPCPTRLAPHEALSAVTDAAVAVTFGLKLLADPQLQDSFHIESRTRCAARGCETTDAEEPRCRQCHQGAGGRGQRAELELPQERSWRHDGGGEEQREGKARRGRQ